MSLTRRLSRVCSEELEDDAKESDEMMDRSMQSDHRASLVSFFRFVSLLQATYFSCITI